jgi:error-prone DNA polymerase
VAQTPYAELHCHTNFSFLDGASAPDDLVERAVELGLSGLAVTDHNGLYGAVRFVSAAEAVGIHPVVGLEIELLDPVVADPSDIVIPPRRPRRRGHRAGDPGRPPDETPPLDPTEGRPVRTRPTRARLPGHRLPVKEDLRGIGERVRGPHLVLLARSQVGWRSLCRLISHANMAGTKGMPRFSQALLAEHTEGLVALSGCRDGELVRRLRTGDPAVLYGYAGQAEKLDIAIAELALDRRPGLALVEHQDQTSPTDRGRRRRLAAPQGHQLVALAGRQVHVFHAPWSRCNLIGSLD